MTGRGMRFVFSLLVIFGFAIKGSIEEINIDLKIQNGNIISELKIGSPPKPYHMLVGTWLSGIWLYSKKACQAKDLSEESREMCKKVTLYDDTTKTADEINKKGKFEVPYLQGTVKGFITHETIRIGENVLENQEVGIVTSWDQSIAENNADGRFDGYFGIRFAIHNEKNEVVGSPFFLSLVNSGKIQEKLYGLYLNAARGKGELRLGGINSQCISGGEHSLMDVPVESGGSLGFLVKIDSIKVGSTEVGKNLKAYIDPSTTFFQGKPNIIKKINDALGASKVLETDENTFYCYPKKSGSKSSKNENVLLKMNNNEFTLDSSFNDHLLKKCSTFAANKGIKDYDLILGSHFLTKYYSVFDVGNKKIRLGKVAYIQ